MTIERAICLGAAVLVALGVGLGFAVLGSPAHARALQLDANTLTTLSLRARTDRRREVLCGDFQLRSADSTHPAGHVCFRFDADGSVIGNRPALTAPAR